MIKVGEIYKMVHFNDYVVVFRIDDKIINYYNINHKFVLDLGIDFFKKVYKPLV